MSFLDDISLLNSWKDSPSALTHRYHTPGSPKPPIWWVFDDLLEKKYVATVPGKSFGSDDNIRFSYAVSSEIIQKGIDRLSQALHQLN